MSNRIEKIMAKVDEKLEASIQKRAELIKLGGSILDEAGAVGGGTLGGVTGMTMGAKLGKGLGKYRALAALFGGVGGGLVGGMSGSSLGQMIADRNRTKNYEEILQDAQVNRNKALMDAVAMKAFTGAGLAQPPHNYTG